MTTSAPEPAAPADPGAQEAVEGLARRWVGRFDNARQVQATLARGGPLEAREGRWRYSQTSLFPQAASGPRWVEASGDIQNGRLHFQSERLRGWAMDVPDAPGTTVLLLESKDGSNLQLQEISQLVEGGRRRFRTTQTLQGGRLVSRSHIDEQKSSDDWRDWSPPRSPTLEGGSDG